MDKVFKVGVFGLAANEQSTLGSIFKLAASRPRQYVVVGPSERAAAEIVLVDADDTNAMNEWRSFNVHHSAIPTVKVVKNPPADTAADVYLRRPLTLKRVLETLDKVTIEAHKYVPELVVGGEGVIDEDRAAGDSENQPVEGLAEKQREKPENHALKCRCANDRGQAAAGQRD